MFVSPGISIFPKFFCRRRFFLQLTLSVCLSDPRIAPLEPALHYGPVRLFCFCFLRRLFSFCVLAPLTGLVFLPPHAYVCSVLSRWFCVSFFPAPRARRRVGFHSVLPESQPNPPTPPPPPHPPPTPPHPPHTDLPPSEPFLPGFLMATPPVVSCTSAPPPRVDLPLGRFSSFHFPPQSPLLDAPFIFFFDPSTMISRQQSAPPSPMLVPP